MNLNLKGFAESMKAEYDAARAAAIEKQITPEILEELRQEIIAEAREAPTLTAEERAAVKEQLILEMNGIAPGKLLSQEIVEQPPAAAAVQNEHPATRIIEGVPHIQQADPEWGDLELGTPGSGATLGRKGCALVCLTTLANYYLGSASNGLIKPPLLNQFFVDNDGWYEQVNVVWGVLNNLFMRWGLEATVSQLRESEGATVEKIHDAVVQGVDAKRPVLLRVRHAKGPHFLVAIGYKTNFRGEITDIITHDPGTHKGDGYGDPPCSLYYNAAHEFDLEGFITYHVLGTPRHPNQSV